MIGDQVAAVLGGAVAGVTALGTGAGGAGTYRVALLAGGNVFVKATGGQDPGFLASEAAGLRWLREAEGVLVPEVLGVSDSLLVTTWIAPGRATRQGAEEFGRQLATLHARGAQSFGAPWPGYIGALPLDNAEEEDWPGFYARRRVLPYLRAAVDRGAVDKQGAGVIERVCDRIEALSGPAELPARIHGDLWAGNIHWDTRGRAWLIDPAAHGGHRETDLAMTALFEPPHLETVVAAYDEVYPLDEDWRERIALHQLHPLLVHAVLFGSSYGVQAVAAARQYL
ncbi:fructosamine kinase family protein [Actinocrinis puniceicyclus]|uniref:Fructosamine kinase family protein n=1 Tax=Actinocrinis puniceicyclus TaxID=977794 RepID=A0A8J8BAS7_9ACTN|nr:fructosamine kinase family protein [Actinocrinis puniceicyclus]MBS2963277.1 fructosamine kinase family protein [Actinocrinis puniceicyclus]